MQSSRLVVTLTDKMETGFESGINQIYKNSHLINDFVVRPSFLLAPTETLWVTFQNAEANPTVQLKSSLMARQTTVANSTEQIVDNNQSQIKQTTETGYEYYLQLPDDILDNAGPWYFSLEIREIPDSANPTQYESISTSDFNSFTVYNSLAGVPGGTPTDLDIAGLYNTAVSIINQGGKVAPYIGEDGYWYVYDVATNSFVRTESKAESVGVAGYQLSYAVGSSGTTIPEEWQDTIPTVPQGSFLWTKVVLMYTDGNSTPFYCVAYQGVDGTTPDTSNLVTTNTSQVINASKYINFPPTGGNMHFIVGDDSDELFTVRRIDGQNRIVIDRMDSGVPLYLINDPGTEGQVFTSHGDKETPSWKDSQVGLFEIPYDPLYLLGNSSPQEGFIDFIANNFDTIQKGAYFKDADTNQTYNLLASYRYNSGPIGNRFTVYQLCFRLAIPNDTVEDYVVSVSPERQTATLKTNSFSQDEFSTVRTLISGQRYDDNFSQTPAVAASPANEGKVVGIHDGQFVAMDMPKAVIPTTYADLVSAKNAGTLQAGCWYRITDYQCTTTQFDTESANHQFDILVLATATNALSEIARACVHEGDTYFANSKLEAWEIKYCLENDINRFAWANITEEGKGIIYYLKDEFNNECPYDFKNIQFRRYKVNNETTWNESADDFFGEGGEYAVLPYLAPIPEMEKLAIDDTEYAFCYTFNSFQNGTTGNPIDMSLYDRHYYNDGETTIYPLSRVAYNVAIKPCYVNQSIDEEIVRNVQILNNIVITEFDFPSPNTPGNAYDTHDIFFEGNCYNMTLGRHCSNSCFGAGCYNNVLGNDCREVRFGDRCSDNLLSSVSGRIKLGQLCGENVFYMCENIELGSISYNNSMYVGSMDICLSQASSFSVGSDCRNIYGGGLYRTTFANNVSYVTILGSCEKLEIDANARNITIDSGCQYITLGGIGASGFLQNVHIHQGVSGNLGAIKIIAVPRNRNFQTNVVAAGTVTIEV